MRILFFGVLLLSSICLIQQFNCKSLYKKSLIDKEFDYLTDFDKQYQISKDKESTDNEILNEETLEYISLVVYPEFLDGIKNSQDEEEFEYQCIEFCNLIYSKSDSIHKCVINCTEKTNDFVKPFRGINLINIFLV